MKIFHSIRGVLMFLLLADSSWAQTAKVNVMMHSAGVEINLPADFDMDEIAFAEISYRAKGSQHWLKAFSPQRVLVNGNQVIKSSLLNLKAVTEYEVSVLLKDSLPVPYFKQFDVIDFKTLGSETEVNKSNLLWVSPNGSGASYSQASPGNLSKLMQSGLVKCGATVMFLDGVYREMNLSLVINSDCSEKTPIQFVAAPGAKPVLEGGVDSGMKWTVHASDPKLFYSALPTGCEYTSLCLIKGRLLYAYPTLSANPLFGNYNLVDMNLGGDGFVRDNANIWIKTKDGLNPDSAGVVVSKGFRFLTIYGGDKSGYLLFKGLTFNHFSKPNVSGSVSYPAMALDIRGVHHIAFDSCTFNYNTLDVHFTSMCSNVLVQNCQFKNQNGLWWHSMIKKSEVSTVFIPTTLGRMNEGGALVFDKGKQIIVRNNRFDGVNSGLVSSLETTGMEEVDVYNNIFIDNFDAVECDGKWSNLRVWGNEFIRPMAGISAAPPLLGPRIFYRNIFHHMQGRQNVQDDPYFSGCEPSSDYKSQGLGIKTNIGGGVAGGGAMYFINNTFYSEDSLGFTMTSWDAEWGELTMANNIICDLKKHPIYFHGLRDKDTFQLASTHDNFYSFLSTSPVVLAKEVHGQFTCHAIYKVEDLQDKLRQVSGSSDIKFEKTLQVDPMFQSTTISGFKLKSSSPMIDAGIKIDGFYDYKGSAPDLGAVEAESFSQAKFPDKSLGLMLFPNPTTGLVQLQSTLNRTPVKIEVVDLAGKMLLRFNHTKSFDVTGLASGNYWVRLFYSEDSSTEIVQLRVQ